MSSLLSRVAICAAVTAPLHVGLHGASRQAHRTCSFVIFPPQFLREPRWSLILRGKELREKTSTVAVVATTKLGCIVHTHEVVAAALVIIPWGGHEALVQPCRRLPAGFGAPPRVHRFLSRARDASEIFVCRIPVHTRNGNASTWGALRKLRQRGCKERMRGSCFAHLP